jgi:RimJ/RimL family protein N-acetyltransferase
MSTKNDLGQPIGTPLPEGWRPPPIPIRPTLTGRTVTVEPLKADEHGPDLFSAFSHDETGVGWTYMANGPYNSLDDFMVWLRRAETSSDPLFFAYLHAKTGQAIGYGSLMRIDAPMATIEIGNIRMSPLLQRTTMSTEVVYLKAEHIFGLGYRRFEWKCDHLNTPSRSAADRLGFTFEGIFRKAMHYKRRSRDTAWYSITDDEWPAIRQAHCAWLAEKNFDADGIQKQRLADLVSAARNR